MCHFGGIQHSDYAVGFSGRHQSRFDSAEAKPNGSVLLLHMVCSALDAALHCGLLLHTHTHTHTLLFPVHSFTSSSHYLLGFR